MAEHGPVPGFAEALGAPVFSGVQADPTTDNVADGLAALAAHEADGVIAVGGGSSLDTGKAVAVMARNDGHDRRLRRLPPDPAGRAPADRRPDDGRDRLAR